MRYGIPYQASKNFVAKRIVDTLPPGECLVDLFAGGCAVTHAALLSGKWKRIIANDISEAPKIFKAAIDGEFSGYATVPDRYQFFAERDSDPVLALLYSFGNDSRSYLWGKSLEPVKVEASRMLSAPSMYERRMHYKKFLKELANYLQREGLERLERLQGLERLEGLQGLEGLERLQVCQMDYKELSIPSGAVVYADPPYRGTCQDCNVAKNSFDYAEFEDWLNEVPFAVYVSELTAPKGCVEIASWERASRLKAGGSNGKVTERLFLKEAKK